MTDVDVPYTEIANVHLVYVGLTQARPNYIIYCVCVWGGGIKEWSSIVHIHNG